MLYTQADGAASGPGGDPTQKECAMEDTFKRSGNL